MVIQECRTGLHWSGHVDPVTPGEDLALQHGLDPDVLGLVQSVATLQLIGVKLCGNRLARQYPSSAWRRGSASNTEQAEHRQARVAGNSG